MLRLLQKMHPISGVGMAKLAIPALAGLLGIMAMAALAGADPCTVPDNGGGTIDLPPAGCGYVSPDDLHKMLDGLPPGTQVNIDAKHSDFINSHTQPGGTLGGNQEDFGSFLLMHLQGTGSLNGYSSNKSMQVQCQTHTAPKQPGQPVQSFDTVMFMLQGQLPAGDPDFDLLRITAGTGFGLPSPGHTTLVSKPGNTWAVDSFFDIEYRIDFVGHSPGPFAGRSGSTTATIRMQAGESTVSTEGKPWSEVKRLYLQK